MRQALSPQAGIFKCKADQIHSDMVVRQLAIILHVPREPGSGCQPQTRVELELKPSVIATVACTGGSEKAVLGTEKKSKHG